MHKGQFRRTKGKPAPWEHESVDKWDGIKIQALDSWAAYNWRDEKGEN